MSTIVRSSSQSVAIGSDQPFVVIGERINPTNRKKLAAEMRARDFTRVANDALSQTAAGARILDVNVGVGSADPETTEPDLMVQCIEAIQTVTDVPLCIDSSVVPALVAGIRAARGRPLINSITGEEDKLEQLLPVIAEHQVSVIGICSDEAGISYDPTVRFAVARKIVERAARYGIPREDILIDPVVMPISVIGTAGTDVLTVVRLVAEELGCNTVCGASNISFGLPNRPLVNRTFLAMAIGAGIAGAITNPLDSEIRHTLAAADLLMNRDEYASHYLRLMRAAQRSATANA